PGNDDAFKSIEIITKAFGKAIEEGLAQRKVDKEDREREKAEQEKKEVDAQPENQDA
ncbi:MAG: 30S ribosomal protein S2, partial [Cytophagia bacterium]|nr:30S ribosomal protein S2 [Cytophagia bacterium]